MEGLTEEEFLQAKTIVFSEPNIDVSQDPMRGIFDRSRPFYIKGVSITVVLPFNGENGLFHFQPSSFTFNPPRGEIVSGEVHLDVC